MTERVYRNARRHVQKSATICLNQPSAFTLHEGKRGAVIGWKNRGSHRSEILVVDRVISGFVKVGIEQRKKLLRKGSGTKNAPNRTQEAAGRAKALASAALLSDRMRFCCHGLRHKVFSANRPEKKRRPSEGAVFMLYATCAKACFGVTPRAAQISRVNSGVLRV